MYITWHGQSCFKFEEKIKNETVTVVTDPFEPKFTGLNLPKLKAEILTVSHYHEDHGNVGAVSENETGQLMLIDRPGEYEYKGVFINGLGSYHDNKEGAERGKSVMFKFDINGVKILHLGDLGVVLSDKQLEKLEEIDILLVPVGGKYTIDAKEASEVVRQIEPRIVIPMHYKIPGLTIDIDGLDKFKKELGGAHETVNKLKVNLKDLPQEETKLIILEKV